VRSERILIEPLFRRLPLAPAIAAIVEQKHRQPQLVEKFQILQPVDDVPGIAVAPEYDWTICLRLNIPTEQPRPIGSLKPHLFKRQPTEPSPVPILPRFRMINEELVEEAHEGRITEPIKGRKGEAVEGEIFLDRLT
jgi:hypothetical protein